VSSNGSNGHGHSRNVRKSDLFERRLAEVSAEYEMAPVIVRGVAWHLGLKAEGMPGSRQVGGTTWVHETDAEHHPALWIYYTLGADECCLQWIEAKDEEIPTKLHR
jgi:hypothetical protein